MTEHLFCKPPHSFSAEPLGESHFGIARLAAEGPPRGVAETFASIVTPSLSAPESIIRGKTLLQRFGRPTKLASGATFQFRLQKTFVCKSLLIADPQPHKVKHFMGKNTAEPPWHLEKLILQKDFAGAQERRRMHGCSLPLSGEQLSPMCSQGWQETHLDAASRQRWEGARDWQTNAPSEFKELPISPRRTD